MRPFGYAFAESRRVMITHGSTKMFPGTTDSRNMEPAARYEEWKNRKGELIGMVRTLVTFCTKQDIWDE